MKIQNKILAVTPFICTIIFLLLGFLENKWHPGWMVYLIIPIMPFLIGKKKIKLSISFIILVIYLIIGIGFGLWHPWWVIFLLIPVFNIIFDRKKIVITRKNNKDYEEID
jgi:hypothetical protein